MDRRIVLTKTAKGLMEVTGRTTMLNRELRAVLAQVDGKLNITELFQKSGKKTEGAFVAQLAKLRTDGFVRELVVAAPEAAPSDAPSKSGDDLDFTAVASQPQSSSSGSADAVRALEAERRKVQEELRLKAEAEAKRKTEDEARRKAAEEERRRAEEEAKRKADAELKRLMEEEVKRRAEEARLKAEAEAKRKAEEEARRKAEEEARRRAEEEARAKAAAEAKRKAEEEARRKAEEEARRKAEEEARRKAEAEARAKAAAEAKRKAEEEARRKAEEEARRRAEEEARAKAEAEAKRKAEEEARRKAEEEARRRAEEEARAKAEAEARRKAEEEARRKAEEEARRKTEEEARRQAEEEARAKAEAEAKRKAEEERRRLEQEAASAEAASRAVGEAAVEDVVVSQAVHSMQVMALDGTVVLGRTPKGVREIAGRTHDLPKELRSVLARIDGKRTLSELQDRHGGEHVSAYVQELLDQGYVEQVEGLTASLMPDSEFDVATAVRSTAATPASRDALADDRAEADEVTRIVLERRALDEMGASVTAQRTQDVDAERVAREALAKAAAGTAVAQPPVPPRDEPAVPPTARAAAALADPEHEEAERVAIEEEKRKARERAEAAARERRKEREKERSLGGNSREGISSVGPSSVSGTPHITHSVAPTAASTPARVAVRRKKMPAWAIPAVLTVTLLGTAGYFLSNELDTGRYEALLAQHLGQEVRVGSVSLSISPKVAIELSQVEIGGKDTFRAQTVRAVPNVATLFGERRTFAHVQLRDARVSADALRSLLDVAGQPGKGLGLRTIDAEAVTIVDAQWTLSNVRLEAALGETGRLDRVFVSDAERSTTATFTPTGKGMANLEIASKHFTLPGAGTSIADFGARGTFAPGEIELKEFDGRVFDGVIKGNARVRMSSTWLIEGALEAKTLELASAGPALFEGGRANGQAKFVASAPTPDRLFAAPSFEGSFKLDKGALHSVDLSRSLVGNELARGTTPYNEGAGMIALKQGRLQISNLKLSAGPLAAAGTAQMERDGSLSGSLSADLRTPGGLVRGNFGLSGQLAKPVFKRGS